MERRVMGNYHARCGTGEKTENIKILPIVISDEYDGD